MKNVMKKILVVLTCLVMMSLMVMPAMADEGTAVVTEAAASAQETSAKAYGAAIAIGITAAAGALGMALAIGKTVEGISRQPEAAGEMRSAMMLGLVFIETAIIYALIVAILLVFVL